MSAARLAAQNVPVARAGEHPSPGTTTLSACWPSAAAHRRAGCPPLRSAEAGLAAGRARWRDRRGSHAAALFTLSPDDDYTDERDETVSVAGSTEGLAVETATLTLSDDDEASTEIGWRISPVTIPEGAGATQVTVTARLNAAARTSDIELTARLVPTHPDYSVEEYADRRELLYAPLVIPADATEGSVVFTVTPVQDDETELVDSTDSNVIPVEIASAPGSLSLSRDADMPGTRPDRIPLTIIDNDSGGPRAVINTCGGTAIIEFFLAGSTTSYSPTTGLVLEDVVLVNTGPATLFEDPAEHGGRFVLTFELLPDFQGEVTVTVPAGVAHDSENRPNYAASCTEYLDNRRPRVEIRGPASDVPVGAPFPVRLVFDERMGGVIRIALKRIGAADTSPVHIRNTLQ